MFAVATDGTAEDIEGRFVGAGAVADEIVRRLMPNELGHEHGRQLRDMASRGSLYYSNVIFYGPNAWILDSVIKPDGSLELSLRDSTSQQIWKTTLRPAEPLSACPYQMNVAHVCVDGAYHP